MKETLKRQEYLKEYVKNCYEPVTRDLVRKTTEYFIAHNEQITAQLVKELEGFMEKVGRMQKVQPIPAGQIAISVLRTSIWEGNTKLRIDCYDQGKEAGRNIAYQYMDGSFLTTEWQNYRDELERGVTEGGYERYIREAQIEQYMSSAIERLIVLFVMNFKYYLSDADYLANFQEMLLAEGFLITAGEYMDWQKILFAQVPEIDIIANPKEQPLIFQKIREKKYRDKKLKDMDLTQARFVNCEFSKCTFEDMILNDVRFVNCLFRDVTMISGTMYGATFIDCVFQNVDMDGMKKEQKNTEGPMRLKDMYRKVRFMECIMDGKRMEKEEA